MSPEQIKEVLQLHSIWIDNPKKCNRVNLKGANLQGANLQGANLQGAYMSFANLQGADLQGANLQGANLQGANMSGAYISNAKFTIELHNSLKLHAAKYDASQFPFLALNISFLEAMRS